MDHQDESKAVRVQEVRSDSPHCEAALELADANRGTLGFFPADAFRAQADAGRLLVALDSRDQVAGYALYRTALERASVTHLCVAASARGQGVGHSLIRGLRSRVRHLRYIEARCRRDFAAHKAWPCLGFAHAAEVRGRGKDRRPITVFRYDLGHGDLFSAPPPDPDVPRCALDASVVIGMQDGSEDCQALLADWIESGVEYVVTAEIRNDLNQAEDPAIRKERLEYANGFTEVQYDPGDYDRLHPVAKELLPAGSRADARHIARASAAGVDVFLTTDSDMLDRAVAILDQLGVRVLHPAELVRELDAVQRADEYAPEKLQGTKVELRVLEPDDLPVVEAALRWGGDGEKHAEFRRLIHDGFQAREISDVLWISDDATGKPLALMVGRQETETRYEVRALRVPPGRASETSLMRVVARRLSYVAIDRAMRRGATLVVVREPHLHPVLVPALEKEGFVPGDHLLVRMILRGVLTSREAAAQAEGLSDQHPELVAACVGHEHPCDEAFATGEESGRLVEARFSPLKLRGVGVRSYIVPIQPRWAEHLFDAGLAGQGLFGADRRLGLAREAVYYRSASGLRMIAPARVLWYVSDDVGYEGVKAIRAASVVDGVEIDTAKRLYKRFRHLGVWRWQHVIESASGDADKPLMALRFSQSERFSRPIHLEDVRAILGSNATFQGPMEIQENAFADIYQRGALNS